MVNCLDVWSLVFLRICTLFFAGIVCVRSYCAHFHSIWLLKKKKILKKSLFSSWVFCGQVIKLHLLPAQFAITWTRRHTCSLYWVQKHVRKKMRMSFWLTPFRHMDPKEMDLRRRKNVHFNELVEFIFIFVIICY